MNLPKISVVTTVKNGAEFIERAIKSLLDQNYPNLEYIFLDAGSTDGTLEIAEKYKEHFAYFHSKPDKGANFAYNLGIDIATGEFITFLNADDYYEGNVLFEIAKTYEENPEAMIISCPTKFVDVSDKILKEFKGSDLDITLKRMMRPCLTNCRFFKKELFQILGKFEAQDSSGNYLMSADREFLIRCVANRIKYANTSDNCYYAYLVHANSSTLAHNVNNIIKCHNQHMRIAERYFDKFPDKTERKIMKRFLYKSHRRLVYYNMIHFELKKVFKLILTFPFKYLFK
ncbi:MAG: glycosyltransferase [Sphingobacteriia bacterium]|nr:glycosyltransferase [Sphingobacteriia bacterium]